MTRIAHVSDLHLLEDDWQRRTGEARYRLSFLCAAVSLDAAERRRRALTTLRRARRLDVDHVLITGDLTEDGAPEQYDVLADVLRQSGLPPERVTLVPGNHDAYGAPDAWDKALEGPLAEYRETSASGACTVVRDAVIQPISTVVESQHFTRAAGIVRREALEQVVRTASDRITRGRTMIVAQHHAPLGMRNPMWNWFDGTLQARPMHDLLRQRPGLHVVHGHVHRNSTTCIDGRAHAQVFSVDSSRDGEVSMRIYRAEDGKLHAEDETTTLPPVSASAMRTPMPAFA